MEQGFQGMKIRDDERPTSVPTQRRLEHLQVAHPRLRQTRATRRRRAAIVPMSDADDLPSLRNYGAFLFICAAAAQVSDGGGSTAKD